MMELPKYKFTLPKDNEAKRRYLAERKLEKKLNKQILERLYELWKKRKTN